MVDYLLFIYFDREEDLLATLDTLVRGPEREENDVRRSILHRTENGTRLQSVTPIRVHSGSFTIHMHLVVQLGSCFPAGAHAFAVR